MKKLILLVLASLMFSFVVNAQDVKSAVARILSACASPPNMNYNSCGVKQAIVVDQLTQQGIAQHTAYNLSTICRDVCLQPATLSYILDYLNQ